jgi:hypothetical protein
MFAGDAVNAVICGKELPPVPGTPPGGTGNTTWLPPQATRVAAMTRIANDAARSLVRSIRGPRVAECLLVRGSPHRRELATHDAL